MPLPPIVAAKTAKDLIAATLAVHVQRQALSAEERGLLARQADDVKWLTAELAATRRPGRGRRVDRDTRAQAVVMAELRAALTDLSVGVSASVTATTMTGRSRHGRLAAKATGQILTRYKSKQNAQLDDQAPR